MTDSFTNNNLSTLIAKEADLNNQCVALNDRWSDEDPADAETLVSINNRYMDEQRVLFKQVRDVRQQIKALMV